MFDRESAKKEVKAIIKGKWPQLFFFSFVLIVIINVPFLVFDLKGMISTSLAQISSSNISVIPNKIMQILSPLLSMHNGSSAAVEFLNAINTIIDSAKSQPLASVFYWSFALKNLFAILFAIFIGNPLSISLCGYAVKIYRGQETSLSKLLLCDGQYKKYVSMGLWLSLWVFIFSLPLNLSSLPYSVLFNDTFAIIVLLALSVLAIWGSIHIMLYALSPYIMCDHPEMSAKSALNLSKQLMKGKRTDYFLLALSFFFWYILSIATLGIALVYVIPYRNATFAAFYDNIKGESTDQAASEKKEAVKH